MPARLAIVLLAFCGLLYGQVPAPPEKKTLLAGELRLRLHTISQLIQVGRLDEAGTALELLRGEAGEQPLIQGMEGFLLYRRHEFARSAEIVGRALDSPKPPAWWRVLLAMDYVALDRDGDANEQIRRGRAENPTGLQEGVQSMTAAAILDIKQKPSPEGVRILSFLALVQGNRQVALNVVKEGAKLFPKDVRLQVSLAGLLAEAGDLPNALASAQKSLEAGGENADLRRILGALNNRKKEYAQAVVHLEKALELDPKDLRARRELAVAYQGLGKLAEARREYEAVASAGTAETALLATVSLSSMLTEAKQWKDAEGVLQKGLASHPEQPVLLNNLAWLYVVAEDPAIKNPKRAVELAEKAVTLSKQLNAAILDTLASAYFALGEIEKAVEHGRKALALAPGNTEFTERLARYEAARKPAK